MTTLEPTYIDHAYPPQQFAPPAPAEPAWMHAPAYPPAPLPVAPAQEGQGLMIAGYTLAGLTALFPILALPGLIVGIILATKPTRRGHGAAVIVLSLVVGVLAFIAWAAINSPGTA